MHTKPKQGTPFRTDRAKLMNCPVSGVQTSAIKRPSAPNHRGSVLRSKHKVNTPGISQTPEQISTSYQPTKDGRKDHLLPRTPAKVSYAGAARRNSILSRRQLPTRITLSKAGGNCLPRRYGCLGSSSRSSLFC